MISERNYFPVNCLHFKAGRKVFRMYPDTVTTVELRLPCPCSEVRDKC